MYTYCEPYLSFFFTLMSYTKIFFILIISSFPCLFSLPLPIPKPPPHDVATSATKLLNSHLQDLAFKAFLRPKTGVPYDAKVPSNLTGVSVSAMRLKSGSLFSRGVQNYREFEIPIGVIEKPYVERIVLVYHNLGNWSKKFYPLPSNYSYLAPVVGLLAYSASNLSASELPQLQLRASKNPILINFPHVKSPPLGSIPKCVHFDLHGSMKFYTLFEGNHTNNSNNNVCSTFQQGHFSIVVESNATKSSSSSPSYAFGPIEKKKKTNLRILIPCLVGGIVLVLLLVVSVRRTKQGTRLQQFQSNSGNLQIASIGDTKAPFAIGTRTRPMIENDYFP